MSDYFCGAGGSSTGATQVPGVTVRMAANHWGLAVETHNTNHPGAAHDCADLSQVDPRRHPRTDLAWFSPECTNHSLARGQRRSPGPDLFGESPAEESAERSRATMWDVVRFAEHHRYRAIVVENVVDAAAWTLWPAWTQAMGALGYRLRLISLNSMHAAALGPAAPQSRDRLYVLAWRQGERAPDIDAWTRPTAACPLHGPVRAIQAWKNPARAVGRYRSQYLWRCPRAECRNTALEPAVRTAAEAIDWTRPAPRISDRARPLSPATMQRIRAGLAAHASPLLVPVEGRAGKKAQPIDRPMRTCTARNETGLAVPPDAEPRSPEDVGFRMLTPAEYASAMAFPSSYVLLGSKRHQVRMAGNAVTPPAARDLVAAIAEALTGHDIARPAADLATAA